MKQNMMVIVALGLLSGCGSYYSYPGMAGGDYGYGYGYPPPVNYGYGYGYAPYPSPAYGYYPGPVYYGRPYGGYGYGYGDDEHPPRPPISNNQKALNYVYDHRNQIQHLPPQQQRQILRQAEKLGQQSNHHRQNKHH